MRTWIEYLITNPSASADFIEWTCEIKGDLNMKLATAVREDDIAGARAYAHELNVYETINSKMKDEMRERAAQIKYETEMKGDEL